MLGETVVEEKLDKVNEQIKQGEIIITNEEILDGQTEKQKYVDAVTGPTMATLLRIKSKEYLEQKEKSLKQKEKPKE